MTFLETAKTGEVGQISSRRDASHNDAAGGKGAVSGRQANAQRLKRKHDGMDLGESKAVAR
jgi:hypothetical protein